MQQEKVKTLVQEWVKCVDVKLTIVADGNATIRISFDISFDPRSGSWSYVGKRTRCT